MSDELDLLRALLTNGLGGAGTAAAIVYLYLRHAKEGQSGVSSIELREAIERQRRYAEDLRLWTEQHRQHLTAVEADVKEIEARQDAIWDLLRESIQVQQE